MELEYLKREEMWALFCSVRDIMEEHAEELCNMDAQMGDGDLGLTMKKGFSVLAEAIRDMEEEDMGKCLMKAGMKMASAVPSTMGTLMASGVMSGGKAILGISRMGPAQFASYLKGFSEGIAKRGKCVQGDCTVLDALLPAAREAGEILEQKPDVSLKDICSAALDGAKNGAEATKDMIPKFGKAAVFAGRSRGIMDQGAYTGWLMIQGYYRYIDSRTQNDDVRE